MEEVVETAEETMQKIREVIASSDTFSNTVSLMRQGCQTVLNRIKNNLDATVNEKSEQEITQFVNSVTNDMSEQTNEWIRQNSNQLLVVPEGTRLVHRDSNFLTIIVEQKPTVRTISFGPQGAVNRFAISLPFIQYYINFNHENGNDRYRDMHISSSTKSIMSLGDTVNHMPLPNIARNGQVCVGNMDTGSRTGVNLVDKINHIISGYWSSVFNYDLNENLDEFFRNNFPEQYQAGPNDNRTSIYLRCFNEWVKATSADPMFCLKAINQEMGQANRFIRNNLASSTGRAALQNRMKERIRDGVSVFVRSLTRDLNTVNILEENRNQPHIVALNDNVKHISITAYNNMWRAIHNRHEQKVLQDNILLDRKKREIESIIRNSEGIINSVNAAKADFDKESIKVKCELYQIHQYLQKQIEDVNELKAKLSHLVDENGNPLPTKRRGRPKKENLPEGVQMNIERVISSSIIRNPDGTPIVRKRGRPRKNPVAVS